MCKRSRKAPSSSRFFCTQCGREGIPLPRIEGQYREPGHLKNLYCIYCKCECNHAEVRPVGAYNLEDFMIEFQHGNFAEDGTRKMPYKKFLRETKEKEGKVGIVYLMIGLPGSGKSTFVNKVKQEGDIYVSRDEVRYSLIGEKDAYFSKERLVFNTFLKKVQEAIDSGANVWIDATHINPSSRSKILGKLRFNNVQDVVAVIVDTPLEECIRRNNLREGRARVPEKAIRDMASNFSYPNVNERWFTKTYIVR